MLNIIIIPAFVVAMLAVYLTAEESVLKRVGKKQSPQDILQAREWIEEAWQEWIDGNQRADDFYAKPVNRLRLWLANIIAP